MISDRMSQYLRTIELNDVDSSVVNDYPFCLHSVRKLKSLDLHPNVTFIIGENGSGKSTLLEAVAIAYGLNAEGGSKNFNFSTCHTHSNLHEHIKLVKGILAPKDSFFLRAESFYNVSTHIEELDINHSYGGKSLHAQSHGEAFISLIVSRFRGKGIYILDEPEAALSPVKQLTLVRLIHELVMDDSQLIIATHSPIIMAYPNSIIYTIDNGYKKTNYKDTEHYQVTKDFINDPERTLHYLLDS